MKKNNIIDITFPISQRMPKWPGSVGFEYKWQMEIPNDTNNLSSFSIDSHLGTHLDAPLHFIEGGMSIENLELEKLLGDVFVLEIYNIKSITDIDLENAGIPKSCNKLILKTDNRLYWKENLTEFQEDFASIDASGAKWIVERGIHLIGIDYLSIQRYKDGPETHQILLKNEVIIVETLDLENISQGWYNLICLPLKLEGLEGSPVRALLIKKNDE
jgi:arylformamidase